MEFGLAQDDVGGFRAQLVPFGAMAARDRLADGFMMTGEGHDDGSGTGVDCSMIETRVTR